MSQRTMNSLVTILHSILVLKRGKIMRYESYKVYFHYVEILNTVECTICSEERTKL